MKYHLIVICIYVCLTIGSMEELKSDIKVTVYSKEKETQKETESAKTTAETKIDTDTKGITGTQNKTETKINMSQKENVETKANENKKENKVKEKEKNQNERKSKESVARPRKKSFPTKQDIPYDYLESLKEHYNIVEDPVGDYERMMKAEYGDEYFDDYEYIYDKIPAYDTYLDESVSKDDTTVSEKIPQSNETLNETDGECEVCKVMESDKKLRLATIKSTILDKLGFSSNNLPNMTGKAIPKIPSLRRVIEQHEMQSDAPYQEYDDYLPEDDFYGQVKRAYTIAQKPPSDFKIHAEGDCYFELTEAVTSRKIKDASLWIYLQPSAFKQKSIVEVYIYIVPQKAKPEHILKGPVRYKKATSPGWLEFKFAHIVHHWIKHPAGNRGVVIQALDEHGINHIVTPGTDTDDTLIPMLEMSTTEQRSDRRRNKRSINHICSEQERIDTCCRYPLRVDFVQFGWDWVIAPTGYVANYCSGECRYRHMENNPQAYLIQQTPDGSSGPCCTPSKFFPLAMLYFDHQHTVLYTYMQKMIVVRCSCA